MIDDYKFPDKFSSTAFKSIKDLLPASLTEEDVVNSFNRSVAGFAKRNIELVYREAEDKQGVTKKFLVFRRKANK